MKRLFFALTALLFLFVNVASSSAGPFYQMSGVVVNAFFSDVTGYPVGEVTDPPLMDLTFVDGFVPTAGGSFTDAEIESIETWNQARTFQLGEYLPGETVTGWFSSTDITNGSAEIDLFEWLGNDGIIVTLYADNTVTLDPNPSGNPLFFTDAIFAAQADSSVEGYTRIQITGSSSNIITNVIDGDTVEFTVNTVVMDEAPVEYRFFVRAGYGEPDWGGNKWTIVQDWSTSNTVSVPFNEPGIYFLACHAERAGEAWAFGDPQTGIVVEVWPAQ